MQIALAKAARSSVSPTKKALARATPLPSAPQYRMKDLCALTGLERQAIHFYIQEGLLPEGRKVGRNMAFYGDEHLTRIRLIKKLQREQFLPLRAIRAVLNGGESHFDPDQRALLLDVKTKLEGRPVLPPRAESVPVAPLLKEHGLEERDVDELSRAGLLAITHTAAKNLGKGRIAQTRIAHSRISSSDAWLLEKLGELRRAGLTRELGFGAGDLVMYSDAVDRLFVIEKKLLLERLAHLEPREVAERVEQVLPIASAMLSLFHTMKARTFFAALGREAEPSARARVDRDRLKEES